MELTYAVTRRKHPVYGESSQCKSSTPRGLTSQTEPISWCNINALFILFLRSIWRFSFLCFRKAICHRTIHHMPAGKKQEQFNQWRRGWEHLSFSPLCVSSVRCGLGATHHFGIKSPLLKTKVIRNHKQTITSVHVWFDLGVCTPVCSIWFCAPFYSCCTQV